MLSFTRTVSSCLELRETSGHVVQEEDHGGPGSGGGGDCDADGVHQHPELPAPSQPSVGGGGSGRGTSGRSWGHSPTVAATCEFCSCLLHQSKLLQ